MSHKRTWGIIVFLIIIGLVLIINFAGMVIEIISRLGLLNNTSVPVRALNIPVLLISIISLISGVLLWIGTLKLSNKIINIWHIFAGSMFLLNIYKIAYPTYLVKLIIYYPFISSLLLVVIWASVFYWLKKKLSQVEVN